MVRRAVPDDAEAIAGVHVESWRTSYKDLLPKEFLDSLSESSYRDRWSRLLPDPSNLIFVVEAAGEVVGFASGGRERAGEDGFTGELYAIYLIDRAKRQGHGRELVRAIVDGLQAMGIDDMIIWALSENQPARRFYERLGGVYIRSQPIVIGSKALEEVAYGWRTLADTFIR
jgi:ribosomal protein S18 acetylase RimI-like enzyme